jgi:HEAT repeats
MSETRARRRERREHQRSAGAWLGRCGCVALALGLASVHADTIMLRGGGQVQGKVVPDPEHKERVLVWLLQGRKPLSIQKGQVLEVIPKESPLDEYIPKRSKTPATAQDQYDLGVWCEQNKLSDLARAHYEAALECNSAFEAAHRKLGHVLYGGHWLTREELSSARGMVKYKGRWVSAEEKAKLDQQEEASAAQGNWLRQVRVLRKAILTGSPDRRREAESQLMAIRDPNAVVPLVRVFGGDDRALRILMVQVISMIPGPAATSALVNELLAEADPEVRSVASDHLKLREDPAAIPKLSRGLSSSNVGVINRAAWALGNLGAVEAVPKLITVLVTTESQIVLATADVPNPGPMYGTLIGPGTPVAPLAVSRGGIALLTPPAVGPGVAAYGAMAFPWYAYPPGIGLGVGVGVGVGAPVDRRPDARVAVFTFQNVEVLAALEKLTGQNFGYDFGAWRNWVSRSFNPNPKPARRVPQP